MIGLDTNILIRYLTQIVYQALQRYKKGQADFSDYLIGVIVCQTGYRETVTFDRKLKKEKGFHCLE